MSSNSSAVIATTELPSCDHTPTTRRQPLKKSAVVCPATATFFALTATIALSCDSRAADFPNSAAYRSLLSMLGTSFWMSAECNGDFAKIDRLGVTEEVPTDEHQDAGRQYFQPRAASP